LRTQANADKVTEALEAFSVARSALPGLQAALAAGRPPSPEDLASLRRAGSALAEAVDVLGLDPGGAALTHLQAEVAAAEGCPDLRGPLGRLAHAASAGAAPGLAALTGDAARLVGAGSWSPADEARASMLARLVDLADLATEDSNHEGRILSLDGELRRGLGPAAAPVILAAARGRLVLPPPGAPAAGTMDHPEPERRAPTNERPQRGPVPSPPANREPEGPVPMQAGVAPDLVTRPAETEVIHTEDLTKVYPGMDVAAVDRLSLNVYRGEIFGLLGPNGAGKTTTAGMLTTRVIPTSGRAIVGGVDVVAHPALAKQALGVVTQQNTLDRSLNVWENLYYHGRFFGMSRRASGEAADRLLEQFHLAKWKKASVSALSGGMAQRLMVARAILHRPHILFLDEPTAGLDPQSRLALWDILSELHAEGQTILLTTHYMEEADQLCDRLAIMDHGKVLALDTPAALKSSLGAQTMVTVSADGDLDALAEVLGRDVDGVTQTRRMDGTVLLHVREASGVLPQVVAAAERGGFSVKDLSVAEPTLESVFIHLTGKELRD
jgi:ABC-2 type transport system ATP-binding protein